MATILQIKRSSGTTSPAELAQGELAYTYGSGSQGNNGDRLFIGTGTETNGVAANIDVIGGKYFTSLTDHVHGTLTASSAIIVDSNKAIDELFIGNSVSTGGTIKFNEGTNNGSNYVALKAPNSVASDITFTLPGTDGTNGQALITNGSGVLSFATISGELTIADDSSSTTTISLGSDTLKISGGTGLSSTISGDNITLNLDNTSVTAGSYGSSTEIPTFTVDAQGRLTAAGTASISTTLTISDDSSSTASITLGSDTLKIAGGTGITSSISGDTITLDIDNTVVTESSTDTLTNKTFDTAGTGNVFKINGNQISSYVGSGANVVLSSSPTITDLYTTGTGMNFAGSTSGNTNVVASATASGTLTLPAATDTLVGKATTDTFTNKTISGSNNTITNIANSSLTNSSITISDDSSSTSTINLGETLKISGGTGIDTTISGDTISISTSSIPNASLENSTITIGSTSFALGETRTAITGIQQLDIDNVRVDGNTISSTDTDGNLTLSPNGSGDINLSADTIVVGDSNSNTTITTNGTGNLVLNTNSGTNAGSITLHQGADGNINLTPNGQGVVKVPSGYLDRTQLDANSLVTKAYVDAVQQGLHVHEAVKVATTTQLTNLIGSSTVTYSNGTDGVGATLTLGAAITQIDGYNLINGDRILVKDELNYAHNGIYIRTNSTLLTRATDFDSAVEVASGDFLFVQEGTVNGNNGFVQTEVCSILGTDDILFTQFSGAGQIIAGDGLLKTGNELDVVVDNTTIEINTDELRVKDAGITASKLATDSVETSKIANNAVTNAKLANSVIYFTDESSTQGSVSLGGNIEFLAGEGIDTTVIGNTVRISGELATSSNAGVAFFPTANFTVTSGSVAITKIDGGTF
jgi:hypothetical protein